MTDRTRFCNGILVVEDEDIIRETVKQILEMEGYPVYTAANGREALEVLSGMRDPCLILLDLMMPVMDGWQFLEEKKKSNVLASLPVIIVSAVADEAKNLGATKYVRKPPDIDTLLKLVETYYHREGGGCRLAA